MYWDNFEGDHSGWDLSIGNCGGQNAPDVLVGGGDLLDEAPEPHECLTNAAEIYLDVGLGECRTTASNRFVGESPGDRFGMAATFIRDIDGDQKDEIVIGSQRAVATGPTHPLACDPLDPEANEAFSNRGRVYVWLSHSLPAPSTGTVILSATAANLIIEGEANGHRFGHSIAPAGDVDGDGWPDFAVGAPGKWQGDAPASPFLGRVYVLSGLVVFQCSNEPPAPPIVITPIIPLIRMHEADPAVPGFYHRFGYDVAYAGDVDGDGKPDLVAGAPQVVFNDDTSDDDHGTFLEVGPGYARVLFGDSAIAPVTLFAPDAAAQPDIWFGHAVAGDVDIDGDGKDDVLVGAPMWDEPDPADPLDPLDDAGKAYVFRGGASVVLCRTHIGSSEGDWFGWSVAGLGRHHFETGESAASEDYAIGSRRFGTGARIPNACAGGPLVPGPCVADLDSGGRICGSALVVEGWTGVALRYYVGEDIKDSAGWAIAWLADMTSDGRSELVVTANRWSPGDVELEFGKIYVLPAPAQ
jgi:hypothetical protein